MPIPIIVYFLLAWLSVPDCGSALSHRHDRMKDVEIVISSWNGCAVTGTINGVNTPLFMDVATCPLHAKIPGRFRARYDQTCGAIVEITNGSAITTPMPPNCESPSPSPTPTPTRTPSIDGTKAPVITDGRGDLWTLGAEKQTLRNGVHAGSGEGVVYKYVANTVYVHGLDNAWYKWTGSGWTWFSPQEPSGPTPAPTSSPTPTPAAPAPTPTPPTPAAKPPIKPCEIGTWCYWSWPSTQDARIATLNNAIVYGCAANGAWIQTGSYVYCVRTR
jgi:hypothetical protein